VNSYQSAQLDAIGDSTRRAILGHLISDGLSRWRTGPRIPDKSTNDFSTPDPQAPNLVTDRAEATRRIYSINPEAIPIVARMLPSVLGLRANS